MKRNHQCKECMYVGYMKCKVYIPFTNSKRKFEKLVCAFGNKYRTINSKYKRPVWCPLEVK